MPDLEEHCKRTFERYGVEGREVHEWLDDPVRVYGGVHRQFRHDTETVRLAGEMFESKYGKTLVENIALDHIMLDHEEEIEKRRTIVVNMPQEREVASIACSYCSTLLKLSDQFCPKCGASRTKIMQKFDRDYEMEKMRLQEERKKLRAELKKELEIRKMYEERSPEERLMFLERDEADSIERSEEEERFHVILSEMVRHDFERYPELKAKFEMDLPELKKRRELEKRNFEEMQARLKATERRNTVVSFVFAFAVLIQWAVLPALVISYLSPVVGVSWLIFWVAVYSLMFRKIIKQAPKRSNDFRFIRVWQGILLFGFACIILTFAFMFLGNLVARPLPLWMLLLLELAGTVLIVFGVRGHLQLPPKFTSSESRKGAD